MTVQTDIEKVIAYCEAIKGNYAIMAQSTEDKRLKKSLIVFGFTSVLYSLTYSRVASMTDIYLTIPFNLI